MRINLASSKPCNPAWEPAVPDTFIGHADGGINGSHSGDKVR